MSSLFDSNRSRCLAVGFLLFGLFLFVVEKLLFRTISLVVGRVVLYVVRL